MTCTLTTTGIDRLAAEPCPAGGWVVRFRSINADMHHQLYLNGRLVEATDDPGVRHFFLDEPAEPVSVVVAAVSQACRTADLSGQLGVEDRDPSWVFRPGIVRPASGGRDDVVEILGDGGTGQVRQMPLDSARIWQPWMLRWSFGLDRMGEGGFGYDGSAAPGMGVGALGAGLFGIGADLIDLQAVLAEEGIHEIVLRTRSPDGRYADSPPMYVDADPPPNPPQGLTATAYDTQTEQLTLQID